MTGHAPCPDRNPTGAGLAAVTSLAGLLVLWNFELGAATLLLVPIFMVWILTVFLGAPLVGPIEFSRLRQLRR